MKVLNVLLENFTGGPQIRVLNVAEKLNKKGVETIIVCPKSEGDFAEVAIKKNFKVYQIRLSSPTNFNNVNSFIKNLKWIFMIPVSTFDIVRIIRQEKIDIVHTNGLLNIHAPLASFLTRKKIVWHLMSSLYPKILVLLLMPFIYRLADGIIVIAEKLGKYYLGDRLSNPKVTIIYEPVDMEKFNRKNISNEDIKKIKKQFNFKISEKIVGLIANVNPVKGHEYFIESACYINRKIKNSKFLIVGNVPISQKKYYERLKNLITEYGMENSIIFAGRREDISSIIATLDILVISSLAEGTPLVILEAMSMEKAVIATDVGAINEQVINNKTGVIIPSKSSRVMANEIINLLKNPDIMEKMGQNGRIIVKSKFSLDKCVNEHENVYRKVLYN